MARTRVSGSQSQTLYLYELLYSIISVLSGSMGHKNDPSCRFFIKETKSATINIFSKKIFSF